MASRYLSIFKLVISQWFLVNLVAHIVCGSVNSIAMPINHADAKQQWRSFLKLVTLKVGPILLGPPLMVHFTKVSRPEVLRITSRKCPGWIHVNSQYGTGFWSRKSFPPKQKFWSAAPVVDTFRWSHLFNHGSRTALEVELFWWRGGAACSSFPIVQCSDVKDLLPLWVEPLSTTSCY